MITTAKQTAVGPEATNGAAGAIQAGIPYIVDVLIEGVADLLFHRWNCEAVAEKANAAKGSAAKKRDDIESYLYRNDAGEICLPGEYVRQAIIGAAKYRQDPRSPRKSATDLFKAAIVSLTPLVGLGIESHHYEHRCRVTVQRSGITRIRPAIKSGWRAEMSFLVNLPEYIAPQILHEVLTQAGQLIGVGDFRPTYGRFQVRRFEVRPT
ncbi:MAG: hypothetical protein Kow00105_20430 [Phycisphaeraceae bacterium]